MSKPELKDQLEGFESSCVNDIPLAKVQEAFNAAIKRRDGRCMIKDYEPCCGKLECSHFFTVDSSPALRFYPPNAYAQCQKHHWNHHHRTEPYFINVYLHWMMGNHYNDYDKMNCLRHKYIKYTDELKAEIIRLCNEDRLEELKTLIEENLK
jgi:hypothetical protein